MGWHLLQVECLDQLLLVPPPKEVSPPVDDALVDRVSPCRLLEREEPEDQHEQNDAAREDVGALTPVSFLTLLLDLRSFVLGCAEARLEEARFVPAFRRSREAEVRQLESEVLVHQNVFKFKVSVRVA